MKLIAPAVTKMISGGGPIATYAFSGAASALSLMQAPQNQIIPKDADNKNYLIGRRPEIP